MLRTPPPTCGSSPGSRARVVDPAPGNGRTRQLTSARELKSTLVRLLDQPLRGFNAQSLYDVLANMMTGRHAFLLARHEQCTAIPHPTEVFRDLICRILRRRNPRSDVTVHRPPHPGESFFPGFCGPAAARSAVMSGACHKSLWALTICLRPSSGGGRLSTSRARVRFAAIPGRSRRLALNSLAYREKNCAAGSSDRRRATRDRRRRVKPNGERTRVPEPGIATVWQPGCASPGTKKARHEAGPFRLVGRADQALSAPMRLASRETFREAVFL